MDNPATMATKPLHPRTAYPSPADEIKHSIAPTSPPHARPIHEAEKRLPSLREVLRQPMSPSTSPPVVSQSYGTSPESSPMSAPVHRNASGNPYAGNSYHATDPQLFPDGTTSATVPPQDQQPLFPPTTNKHVRGRTFSNMTSRRRKRTPHQTLLPSPLEPPRQVVIGLFTRAAADPGQWLIDRRKEDEEYWPSTQQAQQISGAEMSRVASSQGAHATEWTSAKRQRIDRHDSVGQVTKRARTSRGEGQTITRSSPRDGPMASSFLETVLADTSEVRTKPRKTPAKPTTTAAPAVKKVKAKPDEPDTAYELYADHCPNASTLDQGLKFTANWSGKPLNLDNDFDRGLLHAEEVRLASKLALTCARYLYLKRRFYAGRLEYARRSQAYNINAAQQQCKGQDEHGVVGADVNKTSSMWKAFNSVGWLEVGHMQRYI